MKGKIVSGMKKHSHWVMIACCVLPLLLLMFALFGMRQIVPSWIIYLICPIGMIAMIFMMRSHCKEHTAK